MELVDFELIAINFVIHLIKILILTANILYTDIFVSCNLALFKIPKYVA